MKIVLISGKARAAKDTLGGYLRDELRHDGSRVIIIHFADYLKYFCQKYLGWDGEKDDYGRSLLQNIGTVGRNNNSRCWIDIVISIIKGMSTEYDYVLVPDTRYRNEVEDVQVAFENEAKVLTIRVDRPNFDNGLTPEQKSHLSETELDDYKFDCRIQNIGDLSELRESAKDLAKWIKRQ